MPLDGFTLYTEAFKALFPGRRVDDTVSPAALQEMVDRLVAQFGTNPRAAVLGDLGRRLHDLYNNHRARASDACLAEGVAKCERVVREMLEGK